MPSNPEQVSNEITTSDIEIAVGNVTSPDQSDAQARAEAAAAVAYMHNSGQTLTAESIDKAIRDGVCPYLGKIAAEQSPEKAARAARIAERGQRALARQQAAAATIQPAQPVFNREKTTPESNKSVTGLPAAQAAVGRQALNNLQQQLEAVTAASDTLTPKLNHEQFQAIRSSQPSDKAQKPHFALKPINPSLEKTVAPAPPTKPTASYRRPAKTPVAKKSVTTLPAPASKPVHSTEKPRTDLAIRQAAIALPKQPESAANLSPLSQAVSSPSRMSKAVAEAVMYAPLPVTEPGLMKSVVNTEILQSPDVASDFVIAAEAEKQPTDEPLNQAETVLVSAIVEAYRPPLVDTSEASTIDGQQPIPLAEFAQKVTAIITEKRLLADEAPTIVSSGQAGEIASELTALLGTVDVMITKKLLIEFIEENGLAALEKVLLQAYQMRDHAFWMEYNPAVKITGSGKSLSHRFAQLLVSLLSRPALAA